MKTVIMIILAVLIGAFLIACLYSIVYTSRAEKAHPAAGRFVEVNGMKVHMIGRGTSGPVVLMIHGASANASEFAWTLAPRLEETHRVFMVDRPGHGYSDRPDNGNELGVQAAQIAGALEQVAPGEKAVVVGHSFGGAVALRLALDRPDLVRGLVLLAPVTHDWGGGGVAWYNGFASGKYTGFLFSQLVPIVGPAQVRSGIVEVFSPAPVPDSYYEKSAISLLFRPQEFRANAQDVHTLRAELAAQQDRYTELTMPIVVFSGALDTVIKPQLHVGRLKDQAQDLELVKLPDEGHMPHHRRGADVAQAISRLASFADAQ